MTLMYVNILFWAIYYQSLTWFKAIFMGIPLLFTTIWGDSSAGVWSWFSLPRSFYRGFSPSWDPRLLKQANLSNKLEPHPPTLNPRAVAWMGYVSLLLVGGCTNPFEEYARQIGLFPQVGMKIEKYLKPPTRLHGDENPHGKIGKKKNNFKTNPSFRIL